MFKFSDNSGDTHECLGVEHVPDIVLVGRNRESEDIESLWKLHKIYNLQYETQK